MNTNLDKIALDLYGKIQTRFPNIKMGDENAEVLSKKSDIPQARFFEFEYKDNGVSLGTIAITLDEDDGIVLQVSGKLADSKHHGAFKFIRSFRQFAKDRLLNFDVQNIGKDNLDKRDYEHKSKPKEEPVMSQEPMMESKMYGTSKISYQDLGEARLIVKHSQPVNTDLPAGRTMHIEGIWVENADGERFKYPVKHLGGARALAEHLKHGGNPYDSIGQHITNLSEELAQLRKFKGYVTRNEALSEAMGDITSKVMERIEAVKKEVTGLSRKSYYEAFAESFSTREEQMIPEEIMNDWIDRLTIRTFNEELKTVFPYIYRLVDETSVPVKELSPDDILSELSKDTLQSYGNKAVNDITGHLAAGTDADDHKFSKRIKGAQTAYKKEQEKEREERKAKQPEDQFESFIDSIVSEDEISQNGENTLFSPNETTQQQAIDKFNEIMKTELKGGPEGINIIDSLKGLIDDPEFIDSMKNLDPDLDARAAIESELNDMAEKNEDVARVIQQLNFAGDGEIGGEELPPPAPEATPAPAPAPDAGAMPPAPDAGAMPPPEAAPAPVAEGQEEDPPFDPDPPRKNPIATAGKHGQGYSTARHLARSGMIKAIHNAKKAGANLDTTIDLGSKQMTLHDCIEECGMSPKDFGFDTSNDDSGVEQMLKSIAGFWNQENKNFTIGGTRAKTKVVKDFKNGEFSNATEEDLHKVLHAIDRMDPSGNEVGHIKHLAGVQSHNQTMDEASPDEDFASVMQMFKGLHPNDNPADMLAKWKQKNPNAQVTQSNTSSGTVNGKPASYDDAMKQMPKISFGGQDFDPSNPDDMGKKIKDMLGKQMGSMQGQIPNQNIEMPGGGAQINPADFFKNIMGKINFGN